MKKSESEYKLRQRIKELEIERGQLRDQVYIYRQTCMEIYSQMIENLKINSTTITVSWILRRMERCFK